MKRFDSKCWKIVLFVVAIWMLHQSAFAQLEFERDPINYSEAVPTDRVFQLKEKLDSGELNLKYDSKHGYLPALMEYLDVPKSSQTLVFSKTSLQRSRISPRTPRAIYFNDDIYLGWVQQGDVVEISAVDPNLGAVFYTVDQHDRSRAKIVRQTDHCLLCHASSHTQRVPGHVMRSVYSDVSGQPVLSSGTYRTNDTSPLSQRWGGWYVTGTHGGQRHMGNGLVDRSLGPEALDVDEGANLRSLSDRISTKPYLTEHSDIVALMVLGHQVFVHNQLTAANFSGRITGRDADVMNEALERPDGFESDSTLRRYSSAAEKIVKCLLMVDEHLLTSPVSGTSDFVGVFESQGPFDSRGRSLRDLDLETKLFRYPCSFLIYSEAFDGLPERLRDDIYLRLWEILTGKDRSEKFEHLTLVDRTAIREILVDTKQNLPEYWHSKSAASGS